MTGSNKTALVDHDYLAAVILHLSAEGSQNTNPDSPWVSDNFRVNLTHKRDFTVSPNGVPLEVEFHNLNRSFNIKIENFTYRNLKYLIREENQSKSINIFIEGKEIARREFYISKSKDSIKKDVSINIIKDSETIAFQVVDTRDLLLKSSLTLNSNDSSDASKSKNKVDFVKAPMPCLVSQIFVKKGDKIKKGEKLISIGSMKMEYQIKAKADLKINAINCKEGDFADTTSEMIEVEYL